MRFFLSILIFCNFFCFTGFSQQEKEKVLSTSDTSFNKNDNLKLFQQFDSLYKIYGDSVFYYLESFGLDTAFNPLFADSALWNNNELIANLFDIPSPTYPLHPVNDLAQIFSHSQRVALDSIIRLFEQESNNEIVIITIDSSWATTENFDSVILYLHNAWGVGSRNDNNGILIGISTGLRKIRISNGYGIESKLSDSETKQIIDSIIIPEYKKGNFFEGTKNGLFAIMSKIK